LVRELADDGIDVAVACRLLGISRSGYYEWRDRPASPREHENELLLKRITEIHKQSRETYGSPRVHAELTLGLGLVVNEKRVARLMRQAGIRGLYVRRHRGCTMRNPDAEPAGDLVNRQFTATAPNRLWLTDIKCRRRHLRSYADRRTMPIIPVFALVIATAEVRKVGIVA
jgi:putative transposase